MPRTPHACIRKKGAFGPFCFFMHEDSEGARIARVGGSAAQRRLTRNSPPITMNAPTAWKACNCSPSSAQARAAE